MRHFIPQTAYRQTDLPGPGSNSTCLSSLPGLCLHTPFLPPAAVFSPHWLNSLSSGRRRSGRDSSMGKDRHGRKEKENEAGRKEERQTERMTSLPLPVTFPSMASLPLGRRLSSLYLPSSLPFPSLPTTPLPYLLPLHTSFARLFPCYTCLPLSP